jgi:acyl-CoA synthetase (AMP-forming)/AMP-acid ligase II
MYDELPLHTVNDVLDHAAQRFGDRIALVDGPSRYTFRDLHAQVLQASDGLRALGVRPGDRVALWLPNRVEWCVAFYAAVRAGAIVVPLNTGLSVPEATYQLAQSGSTVVVTADKYRSRRLADDALAISGTADRALRVVVVGARVPAGALSWHDIASAPHAPGSLAPPAPDDPVVMLYTSGTTGLPKGALHTHRFLPSLLSARQRLELSEEDCVVLYLPLYHVYALMAGLVLMTAAGAKLVLMERFDAARSLQLMAAERATVVFGVPTTYIDQLAAPAIDATDLSSVRVSITPFPYDLCQRVSARFGVCLNCFGMTETASMALLPRLDDPPETAMGTVGTPLDGLEARVVDEATGTSAPVGYPGALELRGPLIMREYWDKPADTTRAFAPDGWFRTGDIAQLDQYGNVTFIGRQGDHYRVGGESVDPVEVEAALQTHPLVARAAVLGVPDARLGHVGHAWVQPHRGADVIDVDALRAYIALRLAFFKVPRSIDFVDQLPTTPSGKVQKYKLQALLEDAGREPSGATRTKPDETPVVADAP